jgi:hypothetical protein
MLVQEEALLECGSCSRDRMVLKYPPVKERRYANDDELEEEKKVRAAFDSHF